MNESGNHLKGRLDGIAAATMMRRRTRIPVVFVSAYLEEELAERADALAGSEFLAKPIDQEALAAMVAKVSRELPE